MMPMATQFNSKFKNFMDRLCRVYNVLDWCLTLFELYHWTLPLIMSVTFPHLPLLYYIAVLLLHLFGYYLHKMKEKLDKEAK